METINFTRGVPANESFPTTDLIDAATAVFKTHGTAMLQYGPSRGFEPLRQWLAEWQGVERRPHHHQQRLAAADRVPVPADAEAGDLVFTESPSYDRTLNLLRRHGATVVGIPLEADGPNIEALERALQKAVPKFFYVIPDFQNPSGATCSGAKRRQLVTLANRYGFLLVEDAPYRLLRYRGSEEPTLYSLAPDRTLHMSSFTKLIAPGVRTGFMIGEPSIIASLAKVAEDTYISPGYVAQAHHLRMVPARSAAAADRAAQGAVRTAAGCHARGSRQVHARRHGDASRRRLLHFADLARGREHHGRAHQRRDARAQPCRRSRVLSRRRRRAIPAAAVLRALSSRDRRWAQASGRGGEGSALESGFRGFGVPSVCS